MVLHTGISPWVALRAGGVRQPGDSGGGCPWWVPGCLSPAPRALRVNAIPRRGLLPVAPGQLVMSVLKTPERFSKRLEPVSICPVTAVSPRAPHAGQDGSALPGSWPRLTGSLGLGRAIHLPWKAQGVVEARGAVGVATLCWPGQAGARVVSHTGQGSGALSPCLFCSLGCSPGLREVEAWTGCWGGGRGQEGASLGLWLLQSKRGPGICPQAWR